MHFDPALPINARRDDIRAAIEAHPVVIVCGETGSGKTTQLPKILFEMYPNRGRIGHTQPRRIAARSVAARIAEELGSELGALVGYKVRFHDKLSERSVIKLMTDGILLAETQGDRELRQYGSLIIDEAHERSLNIDFLLGFLMQLVERRRDLKVVITSATIDAERFSKHFNNAPVIEVSGRLYPVEVRYRPVAGDAEDTTREEEEQALADAVGELCREGPGDILVFLPGEREIRDAAETLRKKGPKGLELLPLYSRLPAAEQDRIFKPGKERRIVLATNVAETSLTVPRIRYVLDTGDARVKRYSYRNKVEMLRVEPISQAAAQQRAGRCGRVAHGVCIRLYSEEDFAKRAPFTDPELLRSSLAAVILRAKSLGLGEVEAFPFVDPPSPRAIADGYALLTELGAVDEEKNLTPTGEELARLPLDPRVARMLVAAREEGCLREVRIIAAALSVQDPRERPMERAAAADERHARFADEQSDFLAFLKLWKLQGEAGLRRLCRDNFLSYPRMREWYDIHEQLKKTLHEMHWPESSVRPKVQGRLQAEGYRAIHRALLAGLLGNIGMRDEEGAYTGARGIKFRVHPGSWTRKPGTWIVAAELVETTRLFARTVAGIEPKWLEELGAHLLKRDRSDPHWEKDRGQVVALERGTLYGLPIYANRRVPFGPFDPDLARDIFIRSALVEGDFDTRAPFFTHNRRLLAEIERLEHKSRRPDILVDEELIHAFYDERIPKEIHSAADFERWRRQAEAARPRLLYLARDDLMRHEAAGITTENFPPSLELGPNRYALEYHFEPGSPRDGVTMNVPLALLNQVPAARTEWLVPGVLKEKVKALAKSMPQRLRHKLGPLDEFAAAFCAAVPPSDMPLGTALSRFIREEMNLDVPIDAFRPDSAPPHLHMNFRVLDDDGRQLDMGRNLADLKRTLGEKTKAILQEDHVFEKHTGWTMDDLPEIMEIDRGGHTLVGYPALVDAGDAVTLQVFDSPEKARELHRGGVLRLLAIAFRDRIRDIERSLAKDVVLGSLKADVVAAALTRTFLPESAPTTQAEFARRVDEGRSRFTLIAQEIARTAGGILAERAALEKKLNAMTKGFPREIEDVKQQIARLLAPGWLARTPWERLQHLPRYLKAASMRLDKLRADPARDARFAAELASLEQPYRREAAARARRGAPEAAFEQFGWLLEELRVSLFAQELKTPVPVSVKRLAKLWQTLRR